MTPYDIKPGDLVRFAGRFTTINPSSVKFYRVLYVDNGFMLLAFDYEECHQLEDMNPRSDKQLKFMKSHLKKFTDATFAYIETKHVTGHKGYFSLRDKI